MPFRNCLGMIWSVSRFARGSAAATPVRVVNGSMALRHRLGRKRRTSVMRPVTAAAATIAGLIRWVRPPAPCRPSKLRLVLEAQRSPGQVVVVHRDAHRAARLAPFEAGVEEDAVEAFGFGLVAHRGRARDDHGAHAGRDPAAAQHARGVAQVVDAPVGAGADEGVADRIPSSGWPGAAPCTRARASCRGGA